MRVAESLVDCVPYFETIIPCILESKQQQQQTTEQRSGEGGLRVHKLIMEALELCEWEGLVRRLPGHNKVLSKLKSS